MPKDDLTPTAGPSAPTNELCERLRNDDDLSSRIIAADTILAHEATIERQQRELEALRLALHEIDVVVFNTIPPDGEEAAFATLGRIAKIIDPFRKPATPQGEIEVCRCSQQARANRLATRMGAVFVPQGESAPQQEKPNE